MTGAEAFYEAVVAGGRMVARAAAVVSDPARRAVRGRREALARFEEWAASARDPARPLVWVHAPSVGEGLMAQAIIAALRSARPEVQVAFTHFSPSAERIAGEVGADVAGYVPWDSRGPVQRALEALRPAAVAFVRTEVWPTLAREARAAGARVLLVNAVLSERSARMRWPSRRLMRRVYGALDAVGAVTEDHARRYERLGVPAAALRVTGDARFDQVRARIEARGLAEARHRLRAGDPDFGFGGAGGEVAAIFRVLHDPGRFTVIAGSTWASDEAVLVPVLAVLRREHPTRIVFAPHQPTPRHLRSLEERLDRAGLRHVRIGALLAADTAALPDAVLVDRLGILADLYALADLAYVGGGFRGGGLHSVVEPAALGVPVAFGPRHGNAREAGALARAGGGFVVQGPGDVEARIRAFAAHPEALRSAGAAASAYVDAETGAASRNAALILEGL